ncbi:MAG TPA: response regulator [Burkholderiales bacterium]|nr:response regulator [Burkholderiales bacterium]
MTVPELLSRDATVYIVDDDAAVRDSLALLLGVRGFRTACFASAESFLASHRPGEMGCLLLDVRMPGMSGLELQSRLAAQGDPLPVIVITAHGDIPMARAALKAGAEDFLEKPIDEDALLEALHSALDRDSRRIQQAAESARFAERLSGLTLRERQVMDLVAEGRSNRETAQALGISLRTVEVHRARMMDKLGVRSVPELVRLAIAARPARVP